ncbi:hypothetical protein GGF46_004353 [Coemansia sp. RSA 552]|nr:hypothetical protein GGF46_004353 [Coemansia sp. RSA 552]
MPRISVVSFSPFERHHLLLCELDDTMFIVDCGWPTETEDGEQPGGTSKSRTTQGSSAAAPRDALSSINWARVDFVLISNYEQMTLLPYITEYTEFTGPVYATEPTKAYGRCVLEEGLLIGADPEPSSSAAGAKPASSSNGRVRLPYTQQDIVAAMEKVTDVRHNEVIGPVPFVQVFTRSSGYCIGSANWTVEYKSHRTAFISTSALSTCLHPQEWDGSVLADAQAIVFCDAVDPASAEEGDAGAIIQNIQVSQRVNRLCSTALSALKQHSRVLLVGEPYGMTQDIFQVITENIMSLNLPLPQFVVVSSVAERTLQYGNIMGEWLCSTKQAMLYLPEYPFSDKDLRQKGHLHFVHSLGDLATKNIPQGTWFVVVSPQDTATIAHFVRQWQTDAVQCSNAEKNARTGKARFSILIHDDDIARAQRIVNRIPAGDAVTFVPISLRLTYHDIKQCLASAERTQHVLVPSYIHARLPRTAGSLDYSLLEYSYLQATEFDLDTDRHLPLSIQKEMTQQLKRDGKQHAVVSGRLLLAAGEIRFERTDGPGGEAEAGEREGKAGNTSSSASEPAASRPLLPTSNYNLGDWTPARLASELGEIGLNAAVADDTGSDGSGRKELLVRVIVPGGTATIRMQGGWTVDCTSVSAQWTVLDSLRQVLGSASRKL